MPARSNNNSKSSSGTLIFDEVEQQGIEKGIEKEKRTAIIRSWENGIAVSMISNITGVSIDEVEKVIAELKSKN